MREFKIIPKTVKLFIKIKVLGILFLLILISCGGPSTKLMSSWKPEKKETQQYNKIGIGVLIPNFPNRIIVESALEKRFKEKELKAVSTFNTFPLAGKAKEIIANSNLDREEVKKVIEKGITDNKFDAVVLVAIFDVKKETRYVETSSVTIGMSGYGGTGYYGNTYADPYRSGYSDYYAYAVGTVYSNGYYTDEYTYFVECNFYDVKTKKLLWTGRTKTVDLNSLEEEATQFATIVVGELLLKEVIKP